MIQLTETQNIIALEGLNFGCFVAMDAKNLVIVLTLLVLSIQMLFTAADCTVYAQDESKSLEALKRLDPIKGRRFKFTYKDEDDNDKYQYLVSICQDLGSDHAGLIQAEATSDTGTNIGTMKPIVVGRVNNASIKAGTDWIMLTYKGGDKYHSHCGSAARQAHIMITCNPSMEAGNFAVLYEENQAVTETDCYYLMEMESSVACSNLKTGLSTGSILLIVFASLIFAYMCLGMLYKRCVRGEKGIEQVPNIKFWRTCGNLQADGCDCLCRCQESGFDSSRPYRGIADDQLDDDADDENLLPM